MFFQHLDCFLGFLGKVASPTTHLTSVKLDMVAMNFVALELKRKVPALARNQSNLEFDGTDILAIFLSRLLVASSSDHLLPFSFGSPDAILLVLHWIQPASRQMLGNRNPQ